MDASKFVRRWQRKAADVLTALIKKHEGELLPPLLWFLHHLARAAQQAQIRAELAKFALFTVGETQISTQLSLPPARIATPAEMLNRIGNEISKNLSWAFEKAAEVGERIANARAFGGGTKGRRQGRPFVSLWRGESTRNEIFKRSQTHPLLVVDRKANMTENWLMLDGKVCRQSKASDHESVCSTVPERFKHIRDTTHAWVCWHGLEEWQMKLAVDFLLNIVGYRGAWNSDGLSGPQPLARAGTWWLKEHRRQDCLGPSPSLLRVAGVWVLKEHRLQGCLGPRPSRWRTGVREGKFLHTRRRRRRRRRRPSSGRARLWPAEYPESRRLLQVSHRRKSHSR
jgi:hypothetical protein